MKTRIIKSTIAALGLTLTLALGGITTKAAEFSVTEVAAILYTNEATQLLSDADDSTVVVPTVEAGLPISVTGVTSNGYFRIDIGGTTWYVSGIGLSATADTTATADATTTATATTSSTGWTQENVYNAIMSLQSKYPEGMPWSNQEYTRTYIHGMEGGGCIGLAGQILTDVFGDNVGSVIRTGMAYSLSELKVGDVIHWWPSARSDHYAIILFVSDDYVTIVEGNYNGTVHWGRKVTANELFTGYDDDGTTFYKGWVSYDTAY